MSRQRRADCCEYRDERRRLALKRLRNTAKRKTSERGTLDSCEEDEGSRRNRKCDGEKSDNPQKPPRYDSLVDEMLGRIKPSIRNRDKYTADARHARCFLEADEIEKWKRDERILHLHGREPSESGIFIYFYIHIKKKNLFSFFEFIFSPNPVY